jgi:hypothetical protein
LKDLNRHSEEIRDDIEDIEEQISDKEDQLSFDPMNDPNLEYGNPMMEKKDTPITFFLKILGLKDVSRTGNLDKLELGMLPISTRNFQDIANYNKAEGCNMVSAYLDVKGQVILGTSLSKEGFFLRTAVTQIKTETKTRKWADSHKGNWFSKVTGNNSGGDDKE